MAWQRDPKTGEWVMVDTMTPDPMTQGMTGAEPDPSLRDPMPPPRIAPGRGEGYSEPGLRTMPLPVQEMPSRDYAVPPDNADGYTDSELGAIPLSPPDQRAYQNEDYDAIDQWVQDVQSRGNEIRKTAVGTFEVDAGGMIVSEMPKPRYRMN